MAATNDEITLILRRTGDTSASFGNESVQLLWSEAESKYAGYSRDVWKQAVIVARREELWMAAASLITYKQNEASENLSDMPKMLKQLYEDAKGKLDELISGEKPIALRSAVMKCVPTRKKSYPSG